MVLNVVVSSPLLFVELALSLLCAFVLKLRKTSKRVVIRMLQPILCFVELAEVIANVFMMIILKLIDFRGFGRVSRVDQHELGVVTPLGLKSEDLRLKIEEGGADLRLTIEE